MFEDYSIVGKSKNKDELEKIIEKLKLEKTELIEQNEAMRTTQQELEIAMQKYTHIYEYAPVGHILLNIVGIILELNIHAFELLKKERKEIEQKPLSDFVLPEDQTVILNHLNKIKEERKTSECEVRLKRNDDSIKNVRLRSVLIQINNQEYIETIIIDITEKQQAEDIIKEKDAVYKAIVESHKDMICRFNAQGIITYVNDRICEYLKKDRSQLLNCNISEIIQSEKLFEVVARLENSTERYVSEIIEYKIISISGRQKWFRWLCKPIFDDNSRKLIEFQCIGNDVSHEKIVNEIRVESEDKFRNIFDESANGIIILDRMKEIVDLNTSALNMLGIKCVEDAKRYCKIFNELILLQEEQKKKIDNHEKVKLSRKLDFDRITNGKKATIYNRKGVLYVDIIISPIIINNKVKSYIIQLQDITTRKKQEIALVGKNEELEALTLELASKNKKLKELSVTDSLTGLYNRRFIQDTIRHEFERSKRYNTPMSCLMIDIDHFKDINDTYGHLFGDKAIKEIASLLSSNSRAVDLNGRYGGDEFIILTHINLHNAILYAEKLLNIVRDYKFKYKNESVNITISIGIATFNGNMESEEELIRNADYALYYAKNEGRNRARSYEEYKNSE